MIEFATIKHSGQIDKGGNPYILHPIAVMDLLETSDDELKTIAIGHDLLEDTDTTYEDLIALGFSLRIINGIRDLTKIKGQSSKNYKKNLKTNPDAIKVKLADLKHNLDISRLKHITEKDKARIENYLKFYQELEMLDKNPLVIMNKF